MQNLCLVKVQDVQFRHQEWHVASPSPTLPDQSLSIKKSAFFVHFSLEGHRQIFFVVEASPLMPSPSSSSPPNPPPNRWFLARYQEHSTSSACTTDWWNLDFPEISGNFILEQLLAVHVDPFEDLLIIAFSSGHLFSVPLMNLNLVSPVTSLEHVHHCTKDAVIMLTLIGDVEAKLSHVIWSPDDEFVLLLTLASTVILLSRSFEPIKEISLAEAHHEAVKEAAVSIGWGKRETQFLGPGKRATLRDAVHNKNEPEESFVQDSDVEDNEASLFAAWSYDSTKFALCFHDPSLGRRIFKVYDRDFSLLSVSEAPSNQKEYLNDAIIAWRSCGNLLACYAPLSSSILFYEPNGLRHGEFMLKSSLAPDFAINALAWNSDSSILAIVYHTKVASGIQFWTCSNYCWELKLDITSQHSICLFEWDRESPALFHYSTCSALWSMKITKSYSSCVPMRGVADNDALSVVIDGSTLKITPFRWMVYPPPMCAYTITTPSEHFVTNVSIVPTIVPDTGAPSGDESRYMLAALTSLGCVYVFSLSLVTSTKPVEISHSLVYELTSPSKGLPRSLSWLDHDRLAVLMYIEGEGNALISIQDDVLLFKEKVVDCHFACKGKYYYSSGTCLRSISSSLEEPVDAASMISGPFNSSSSTIPSSFIPGGIDSFVVCADDFIIAHDSSTQKLFVNSILFLSGISSFIVSAEFLIVTTVLYNHQLLFFPLSSSSPNILLSSWNSMMTKYKAIKALPVKSITPDDDRFLLYFERKLERGGLISHVIEQRAVDGHAISTDDAFVLTAATKNSSIAGDNLGGLVLQMPRGNLELIYPRPLLLSIFKAMVLHQKNYTAAYWLCRRHKLDMTLFIEVKGLDTFLRSDELSEFLRQIANPEFLNIFLGALSNSLAAGGSANLSSSDINRIAVEVRRSLLHFSDSAPYLEPILMTFLMEQPAAFPDLFSFLSILDSDVLNQALKFVLLFVKGDLLFDSSLLHSAFSLTKSIAKYCQKDPSEYLPLLDAIDSALQIERNAWRARFLAFQYLGKYDAALECLFDGYVTLSPITQTQNDSKSNLLSSLGFKRTHPKPLSLDVDSELIKALENEIRAFVQTHNLYSVAIACVHCKNIPSGTALFNELFLLQAEHCESSSPLDAATYFMLAGANARAVRSLLSSCSRPLTVLCYLKDERGALESADEWHSLLGTYAGALCNESRYSDAAVIYEIGLDDVESALTCLSKAKKSMNSCVELLLRSNRTDLMQTSLCDVIWSNFEALRALLNKNKTEFTECLARLMEVRRQKACKLTKLDEFKDRNRSTMPNVDQMSSEELIALMNEEFYRLNTDDPEKGLVEMSRDDLISEAGTLASTASSKHSFITSSSRRSSRSKASKRGNTAKEMERKRKAAAKLNSPFEEWYLLDNLHRLINVLFKDLLDELIDVVQAVCALPPQLCQRFHDLYEVKRSFLEYRQLLMASKTDIIPQDGAWPELPVGSGLSDFEKKELSKDLQMVHVLLTVDYEQFLESSQVLAKLDKFSKLLPF